MGFQKVVDHDGGGLALCHGFARGIEFVFRQVHGVVSGVERDVGRRLVAPLVQVDMLVLQGMGELVGEHGLLLVESDPIEQVHGFVFGS